MAEENINLEDIFTNKHGSRFVFYAERNQWNPKVKKQARKVLDTLNLTLDHISDPMKISNYFTSLASSELTHEKNMLVSVFGNQAISSYNYEDAQDNGKAIIYAINAVFNMEKVFNRLMAMITETKGQRWLLVSFPYYLTQALHNSADRLFNATQLLWQNGNITLRDAFQQVLNGMLSDLVRETLINMFSNNVGVEGGIQNPEQYQDAYNMFMDILKDANNQTGNNFIQSFIDQYQLSKIGDYLLEELTNPNILSKADIEKFDYNKKLGAQVYSKGGLAAENFGTFIMNVIGENLRKNSKGRISFEAVLTGHKQLKPDFMGVLNIPLRPIQNWVNSLSSQRQTKGGKRAENVRQMQSLLNTIHQYKNGFLIYSNAKNYTLNDAFEERGGFESGDDMSLKNWEAMMQETPLKSKNLIHIILQTLDGAIGENKREEIARMFSMAIATALFDDFQEIYDPPKDNPNGIHLLYLDGIYIPLSTYFYLLADAFAKYAQEINTSLVNQYITVDIESPAVIDELTTRKGTAMWKKAHPNDSPWPYQANKAMQETRIGFHFMAGFKKLMKDIRVN